MAKPRKSKYTVSFNVKDDSGRTLFGFDASPEGWMFLSNKDFQILCVTNHHNKDFQDTLYQRLNDILHPEGYPLS